MEKEFIHTIHTINVYPSNMSAMEQVNKVTGDIYVLNSVTNGLIVFKRRPDYESLLMKTISIEDSPAPIPTIKQEDAETLQMLAELRKKLKITDADLNGDLRATKPM